MAVRRAAVAAICAGAALLVTTSVPELGLNAPYLLPFGAVMLSAWYAGMAGGVAATALLAGGVQYVLLPPQGSFSIASAGDVVRLTLFAAVALSISLIVERGRKTAATLQATLWNIDDGVIVTDRQARVTFMNPVAQRLTGWSLHEADARPIADVYRTLDERSREPAINRIEGMLRDSALREGTILEPMRERLLLSRDGAERPVEDSAASVVDEQGGRVGAVLVFHDTSEQRAAREAAERANRLKDEFLATLSHELRTPLNAVLGWTKMLRRGAMAPEASARAIDAVDRNADALASLVSDLLDVSRIVTGRLRLQPRETDLAGLLRESADAMAPTIAARNVRLDVELADLPPAVVDPDRLRQVVWNLLSNAAKFTQAGGTIALRARAADQMVRIQVADTGIGIDPAALPFVFNRFWQADSAATRAVGGLGLGLAIVRHLVEAHGGSIAAYSEGAGRGATFTVELPVTVGAVSPAAAQPGSAAGAGPPLRGVRVLAVDDEEDSLAFAAAALLAAGADVRTAGSADQALAMMAVSPPDVLVADIAMPGKDGYTLLRELRGRPAGAGPPAVALTAYAGELHRRAALDAGFTEHLEKPVDPDRLTAVVSELARRTVAS